MIDWLTILLALAIIAVLVGIFAFMAWKINVPDPLAADSTGKKDENNQSTDYSSTKRRKDKHGNDQSSKKRKDPRKVKRENKTEDRERHNSVTFKEPPTPTSEETDDEREESDQETSTPTPPVPVAEVTTTARRRHKNKANPIIPPSASAHPEGILANRDEKSPTTTRAAILPHPKQAISIPKDEVELAKQHQQPGQQKSASGANKQAAPAAAPPAKKVVTPATAVNREAQQQQQQEQPFTTVVNSRNKAGTPPLQQQQQQTKPANAPTAAPPVPTAPVQQPAPVQAQQEPLAQRQPPQPPRDRPAQVNGFNANTSAVKQQPPAAATPPLRIADIIKTLPTSQVVVSELMLALDAYPLSTDELNIVMHKIANKQAVVKQDWSKLQLGQKVDPQAQIGQAMDESARAFEEDMKKNAMARIKELTDQLNNEKRRVNDLSKAGNEKDLTIQALHARFDVSQRQQPPAQLNAQQQNQFQTLQLQVQRLTEDNIQLTQRLAQQQQQKTFQQQQQFSSLNAINPNDPVHMQNHILNDQMKKLSLANAEWEKNVKASQALVQQAQKEKEDILRLNQQLNQQLNQNLQDIPKFQQNEEKLMKELNENRAVHNHQLNELKGLIEQLKRENEQIRRQEVLQVQPKAAAPDAASNKEEREQLEKEIEQLKQTVDAHQQRYDQQGMEYAQAKQQMSNESEQFKQKLEEVKNQHQSQENELRQEIERLKQERAAQGNQQNESLTNELNAKNGQIDALRTELEQLKATNDSNARQVDERLGEAQERQKKLLLDILPEGVRHQLAHDQPDFGQWFSSYRQLLESNIESDKRSLQEASTTLKRENDQLHKNMNDIESQLKEIEQTVQSKEELLLADLKSKDTTLEIIGGENEQLNGEIQRLRSEIDRLQLEHQTAANEIRTLKVQLEERTLLTHDQPVTAPDESFDFDRQPSPTKTDARAEELSELIRSGKEALETQDSLVQQLDKHIDEMHRGGPGETSTSNVDQSAVSSDQQQQPPDS